MFELRPTVCIFLIGNAGHKSITGSGGHKSTNSKNHSQESISDKTKKQPEKPIFSPDTSDEEDLDSGSGDKIDIDETDEEDGHIISPDEGDNENNRQSGNNFDTNSGGDNGEDDLTTEIEEKILKIDNIPSKLKLFPLRLKTHSHKTNLQKNRNTKTEIYFCNSIYSFCFSAFNLFVHNLFAIKKKKENNAKKIDMKML